MHLLKENHFLPHQQHHLRRLRLRMPLNMLVYSHHPMVRGSNSKLKGRSWHSFTGNVRLFLSALDGICFWLRIPILVITYWDSRANTAKLPKLTTEVIGIRARIILVHARSPLLRNGTDLLVITPTTVPGMVIQELFYARANFLRMEFSR